MFWLAMMIFIVRTELTAALGSMVVSWVVIYGRRNSVSQRTNDQQGYAHAYDGGTKNMDLEKHSVNS